MAKSYHTAWVNASSHADWASTLLRGVFRDEAKFMRMRPRNPENIKFSEDFLSNAKGQCPMHYLLNVLALK
jgi:hypothetical protein